MALILGAGFEAAMEKTVEVSIEIPTVDVVEPEQETEVQMEPTAVVEEPVFEPESIARPEPEAQPQGPDHKPEDDDDDDDGIQFIIRHDNDDDT